MPIGRSLGLMRGARAFHGRPRLANLMVAPKLRLEGVNSGWYQSQGNGNEIICRVQRLIMLARGIGVQVIVVGTRVMETGALIVPTE